MGKQLQVTKNMLQDLTKRMKELDYEAFKIKRIKRMVNELQREGVHGVDKFIQKLLNNIDNEESYRDIDKEGRFAIVLTRNGFSEVTFVKEDIEHKLPDLKAIWNRSTVYFEITRKRTVEDEWAEPLEDPKLPSNKTANIVGKIKAKLKQLMPNEINIVVFWSSTLAVQKSEMEEALKHITNDPENYRDLSGVLFTEDGGISIPTFEQFYLFKNAKAAKLLGIRLTKKLEALHEKDVKKFLEGHQSILEWLIQPEDER